MKTMIRSRAGCFRDHIIFFRFISVDANFIIFLNFPGPDIKSRYKENV